MSQSRRQSTSHPAVSLSVLLWGLLAAFCHGDILFQPESRERFPEVPFPFFYIEAEDFHTNDPRGDGAGWLLSSDPLALAETAHPDFEPDPNAFASGGESITNTIQSLVTNNEGGGHDVQYLVQFDTPGTYHLYIRQHSPLGPNNDRNKHDSFYYPIHFGDSPDQNKANGDDYGILESVVAGNVMERGPWVWFAARTTVENAEADPPIDQRPSTFLEWNITDDMLDENLVLEFDHREAGTMLDAFVFIDVNAGIPPTNGLGPDGEGFFGPGDLADLVFGLSNLGGLNCDIDGDGDCGFADIDIVNDAIQNASTDTRFDVSGDGVVDISDRDEILTAIGALPGDADLNGTTDASDLNAIGTNWLVEHGSPSWSKGDFNGDGVTDASDLNVVGLWWQKTNEDFVNPAAAATANPVPEPTVNLLFTLSMIGLASGVARRNRHR